MIQDLALRWVVTLLFLFSAVVCISAIAGNRHAVASVISHCLHAIMAIAMAVMAWPRGAELPSRAPMIFFLAAAIWFAVVTVRTAGHHVANVYHTLMMLAMAWMYASMGGLPLRQREDSASTAMPGMDMGPGTDMDMADTGGPDGSSGHAGHAGHAGHSAAMHSGTEPTPWIDGLNWLCTIGFAAAAVFWLYRFITARVQSSNDESHSSVGILCQLAMAAGMAIMFGVML